MPRPLPRAVAPFAVARRLAAAAIAAAIGALAVVGAAAPLAAQESAPAARRSSAAGQPRIIVIPYVREGEDVRTLLDRDFSRRMALATIKSAFDRRRLPTVDFFGALQQARVGAAQAMESESDFRTRLFEANRADVYVVADLELGRRDDLESATVLLQAHLTANGMSLGSASGTSDFRRGVPAERLTQRAVENAVDTLLDALGERMDEFWEEGVPVMLEFRVAGGSRVNLDTPVGGTARTVADTIEAWLGATAHRGAYSVANVTPNLMTVTDVRLPMRDALDRPPSLLRFSAELLAHLRSVGVRSPDRRITTGAVYVDLR